MEMRTNPDKCLTLFHLSAADKNTYIQKHMQKVYIFLIFSRKQGYRVAYLREKNTKISSYKRCVKNQ